MYSFMSSFVFSTILAFTRPPCRPAAGGRLLRWCRTANRHFLKLAVHAVVAALLRTALFFTLETDSRRFSPLVLTQLCLALLQRLLEGGHAPPVEAPPVESPPIVQRARHRA